MGQNPYNLFGENMHKCVTSLNLPEPKKRHEDPTNHNNAFGRMPRSSIESKIEIVIYDVYPATTDIELSSAFESDVQAAF